MPDPAARDLLKRHHRRLAVYLRALLPGTDPDHALREAGERLLRRADRSAAEQTAGWVDDLARQVAADRRKSITPLPFSDDLFRQLADSSGPILDQADARPAALAEILRQLPPPERELLRRRYKDGLTAEQIARTDGRPTAAVARELTALHGSLVSAMREALPDAGPEPPGGAADLGRLSDQLLDSTITEDGRLVLETLLLADAAAQVHYHRHAALATDLNRQYGRPPSLPDPPPEAPRGLTTRERVITAAFLAAVAAVAAFIVLQLAGHL